MSIPDEHLFFQEDFFELKYVDLLFIGLLVSKRKTPLGTIPESQFQLKVTQRMAKVFNRLLKYNDDLTDLFENWGDAKRELRDQINKPARKFGIRVVIREDNNEFLTECNY